MKKTLASSRSSVAVVIAFAALVFAIAGSALAEPWGRNEPESARAVSKAKVKSIAAKQVKKLAPELEVKSARTAKSADTAARADTATAAEEAARVNGLAVKEIAFRTAPNNTVRNILEFPQKLRIDAQCANFGDRLDLAAFTAVDDSVISLNSTALGADDSDGRREIRLDSDFNLDANEGYAIDNQLVPSGAPPFGVWQATLQFAAPDGFSATVHLTINSFDSFCQVTGTAIGG